MENSHAIFEFYWRQKQHHAEARYIENTELHEDNHPEEEHHDVCDEESEEESGVFFQLLVNDKVKKTKHRESEHT